MKIIERNSNKEKELKHSILVKFLYKTIIGRFILKLFANRTFANFGGKFMNSKWSIFLKNRVIKKHNIDMSKYLNIEYNSYNKFFTRKYRDEYLKIDNKKTSFISPCDSKLMILKISDRNNFKIKNSFYKLEDIINDSCIEKYKNGYLLIFRLDVNDYHRYCYVDDGTRSDYQYIDGILHTVQPIAYEETKVFHQNAREWCVLKTNNFDDIIQVEVGALLVGKIVNDKNKVSFKKGEEKGYFEFGGSTILMFVKNNVIEFDEDILNNSNNGNETIVKYGMRIGVKK